MAGILRLRSEEAAGRVEAVLVTGSTRSGLLGGWTLVVAVQAVVMLVVIGLGAGLGVAAGTGDGGWVWDLVLASLAYVPATLLVAAVAIALYGLVPRLSSLAWVLVIWAALALYLGGLLNLPEWALSLSPIHHTPQVPAEAAAATPLVVMGLAAVAVAAVGFLGLRRRDVVSGG